MEKLYSLLALLMSASIIHQTNHWNSKGKNFYGDHELFQRLYEENQSGIDAVAEKILGLNVEKSLDSLKLTQMVFENVKKIESKELAQSSIAIEKLILDELKSILDSNDITPGSSNLLEGIYDTHESFVYLLQQRYMKSEAIKSDTIVKMAEEFSKMVTDILDQGSKIKYQQNMRAFQADLNKKYEQDSNQQLAMAQADLKHNQYYLGLAFKASQAALNAVDIYSDDQAAILIRQVIGYLSNLHKTIDLQNSSTKLSSDMPQVLSMIEVAQTKTSSKDCKNYLMSAHRAAIAVNPSPTEPPAVIYNEPSHGA